MEHDKVEKLMDRIKKLEDEINEIKMSLGKFEDFILRLAICKQTDPKYPYYDYIVTYRISPETQFKIDLLFGLISEKVESKKIPARFKKIKDFSTDFLYDDNPLQYKDVEKEIMHILGAKDAGVPVMFIKAMRDQGIQVKLCDYLLSQIDEVDL